MKISLIIPCYNEAKNIPILLSRCSVLCKGTNNIEIIIVDNGSYDDTQKILSDLLPKFPWCSSIRVEKNIGYGFGILAGLKEAAGDIIGWTHADLQTDPLDILKGIGYFSSNSMNVFVKGKRYGRPFFDVIFTIGMSLFETFLLRKFLWDINAQPTLFSKKFFETWNNPPADFSLDLYAYFMAKKKGLDVFRFPVFFAKRAHGVSSWNVDLKSKFRFIKRTLHYSIKLKKKSDVNNLS